MAYDDVHLPSGYEVAVKAEGDGDFVDLGVMGDDGELAFSYDTREYLGSKGEPVIQGIYNQQVTATFSLVQLNLANISKLMGGASEYTALTGKMTTGSTSVTLTPMEVRIRKILVDGVTPEYWTATIYSATNTGGLTFSFPRADAENPTLLNVTMTGKIDPERTDKDMLMSIVDDTAVT